MMLMCPVTLCSVLLFVGTVTGEHRAVSPTPTIEVKRGDNAVLRCPLEVDLSAYTVEWKRVDLQEPNEVHVYRSKGDDLHTQRDQYKNRTTLDHEELSRGIVTLQISSVQPSDSGPYKCYIPKLKAGCTIILTVVEENQQSTTGPPEEDEPNNPNFPSDAAKIEPQRKIIIPAVVFGVAVAAGLVVVFLVKRGKIQIVKKTQEAETTSPEMNNLMPQTTTTTTDQHNAAGNVQGESVVDIDE